MNDITVWGIGTPRTMRVHWMLAELGLAYDCRPITSRSGETMTAEFLALNPKHKIPVLRHGAMVLSESAAIITYLADKGAALNMVDQRRVSPGSFVNRVGPEKLRVFYIQLLKDRKVETKRAPD